MHDVCLNISCAPITQEEENFHTRPCNKAEQIHASTDSNNKRSPVEHILPAFTTKIYHALQHTERYGRKPDNTKTGHNKRGDPTRFQSSGLKHDDLEPEMPQRDDVGGKRDPKDSITRATLRRDEKGDADSGGSEEPSGVHAGEGRGSSFLSVAVESIVRRLRFEIRAYGGA